jgi:hypothetical protein
VGVSPAIVLFISAFQLSEFQFLLIAFAITQMRTLLTASNLKRLK